MAANSMSRPAFALQPGALRENTGREGAPSGPARPDAERLLTELSDLFKPPAGAIPELEAGRRAVVLSPVSQYYLAKLRADCRARGVRLHVLPCPVSNERNRVEYVDIDKIYDGPMLGDIPAEHFGDSVHLKREYVIPVRARMIELYRLPLDRTQPASRLGVNDPSNRQ
jgi:hypothetical protein